jgi:hypothetical protein
MTNLQNWFSVGIIDVVFEADYFAGNNTKWQKKTKSK